MSNPYYVSGPAGTSAQQGNSNYNPTQVLYGDPNAYYNANGPIVGPGTPWDALAKQLNSMGTSLDAPFSNGPYFNPDTSADVSWSGY